VIQQDAGPVVVDSQGRYAHSKTRSAFFLSSLIFCAECIKSSGLCFAIRSQSQLGKGNSNSAVIRVVSVFIRREGFRVMKKLL
jgi:hypothetical protein